MDLRKKCQERGEGKWAKKKFHGTPLGFRLGMGGIKDDRGLSSRAEIPGKGRGKHVYNVTDERICFNTILRII